MRLEYVLVVEVVPSNMLPLFEVPDTVGGWLVSFGSKLVFPLRRVVRLWKRWEWGWKKYIRGSGGIQRAKILLKTKMVLREDVIGNGVGEAQKWGYDIVT